AEALEECAPPVGGHHPTEDDGRAQRAATWQLEEALEIGFDDAAAVGSPAGQYEDVGPDAVDAPLGRVAGERPRLGRIVGGERVEIAAEDGFARDGGGEGVLAHGVE